MVLQSLLLAVVLNITTGAFDSPKFYAPMDIDHVFSERTMTDYSASVTPLATTTYDSENTPFGTTDGTWASDSRQRRRASGFEDGGTEGTPDDPGLPVGDIPWGCMLLLSALTALRLSRKSLIS